MPNQPTPDMIESFREEMTGAIKGKNADKIKDAIQNLIKSMGVEVRESWNATGYQTPPVNAAQRPETSHAKKVVKRMPCRPGPDPKEAFRKKLNDAAKSGNYEAIQAAVRELLRSYGINYSDYSRKEKTAPCPGRPCHPRPKPQPYKPWHKPDC